MSVPPDKHVLRQSALEHRRQLPSQTIVTAGRAIHERLRQWTGWGAAKKIHTYVDALPGEVPTRELIAHALSMDRQIVIPVVDTDRQLRHHLLTDLDELCRGPMNLWQPRHPLWVEDLSDLDVILVPAAVFDMRGHRIGLGGGYYDRLLADLPASTQRVGLIYDAWLHERVPSEAHDQPVDLIITERSSYPVTEHIPTESS